MDELKSIIAEIQMPSAYHHFAEGEAPQPPFICWLLPGSNNFSADGMVYFKINKAHIELYTDKKDLAAEGAIETVLDAHEVFYNKAEDWIEEERLYVVVYTLSMEG